MGGSDFSTIFNLDSRLIYGIGALTQPIFEGGRWRGQLQLSEETKKEMVLNYEKTIAGAFRNASDALIAVKKQRVAREEREKLVAATEDATRLARIRYQGGADLILQRVHPDDVELLKISPTANRVSCSRLSNCAVACALRTVNRIDRKRRPDCQNVEASGVCDDCLRLRTTGKSVCRHCLLLWLISSQ
jgi:hypothetical protein